MTTLGLEYLKHQEQARHNASVEAETKRSNQAQESISSQRNIWEHSDRQESLDETNRKNSLEHQDRLLNAELSSVKTKYEHMDRESALAESERHNKETESLTSLNNLLQHADRQEANFETKRHNIATETETTRHNTVGETQGWWTTIANALDKGSQMSERGIDTVTKVLPLVK